MTPADPQPDDQPEGSFAKVFFSEMLVRGGLLVGVMLLSFLGSTIGRGISDDGALTGALVGLAVGVCLLLVILSRRR